MTDYLLGVDQKIPEGLIKIMFPGGLKLQLDQVLNLGFGPGWCGSVDCVPAYKLKGCQFNSQSGHMPGLWAGSPVRG